MAGGRYAARVHQAPDPSRKPDKSRTPRFISQFATLQAERPAPKSPLWRRVVLLVALACAIALAFYDIFGGLARSS